MIRKLFAKINRTLAERVISPRKNFHVPIRVWFEPDGKTGQLKVSTGSLSMMGETNDLSSSGIGFIVSSIRIKENYLVGEGRALNVELDVPGEKVRMRVVGERYEQVGQHISTAKYLIGARIVHISEEAREAYEHFLRYGKKNQNGSLALGIDKS